MQQSVSWFASEMQHAACLDQLLIVMIVAYSLQSRAIKKRLIAITRLIAKLGIIYTTWRGTWRRSEYQMLLPPHSPYIGQL